MMRPIEAPGMADNRIEITAEGDGAERCMVVDLVDCTGDRATLGVWRGATEREALAGAYQILAAAQAAIAVRL